MSIFLHQWLIYQHHFTSCIIIYLTNFQSLNVRYIKNLLYYIDNSMNKDVLTSVCRFLCEYGYVPRNVIAGSYDKPILGFCVFFWETIFWSDCISLHFHQQLVRVPAAPHSHQHLAMSVFWVLPVFIDVLLSLLFILICTPPMIQDMELLFNIFICHLYIFFDEVFGPFLRQFACFLIVDF